MSRTTRTSQLPALALVALALLAQSGVAHIALWHPAMFGWDSSDINQYDAVAPLFDLPFDTSEGGQGGWWFHGYKDKEPEEGVRMSLPAGGVFHGEVACNKAQTSYNPDKDESQLGEWACDSGTGPMHTTDTWGSEEPRDVRGCGLAIAYTSDEHTVKPEDFTVISVDYQCPWKRKVDFPVPADLPSCPEGGCLCSWGWVHGPDSGSEQMYHLVYRCDVTGATGTRALPPPMTANKCDYPGNTANCTVGGKQPHYWLQKERNNNFQGYYDPPYYNGQYGFMQGAQTDLFAGTSGDEATSQVAVPTVDSTTADPITADPTTAVVPSSTSEASVQAPPTTTAFSSTIVASLTTAATTTPATTTPAPAQTTSLSKVCRRSQQPGRHPLVNYARRARRNTRAARRLAAEQVDGRRVLEDRRALYARGLELMRQGKA